MALRFDVGLDVKAVADDEKDKRALNQRLKNWDV